MRNSVDVFEDEDVGVGGAIFGEIEEVDDVGDTAEIHENEDFSGETLLLHGFEDLQYTGLTVEEIGTGEDFRVLSSTDFLDGLIGCW